MTREICAACGRISRVGFGVPAHIWAAAVPPRWRNETLCLACFTEYADDAMIAWDQGIAFYPVSLWTHKELLNGKVAKK